MGIKHDVVKWLFKMIPYSFFNKNYIVLANSKLTDFACREYSNKFFKNSKLIKDFDTCISEVEKIISTALFSREFLNIK